MVITGLSFYRQKHPTTCTPYSLATVMGQLGQPLAPADLIRELKTHAWQGTDFCYTLYFLKQRGLYVAPFCAPVARTTVLLDKQWPLLIFRRQATGIHCSVLYGYTAEGQFLVHDPSLGEVVCQAQEIDCSGSDSQFGGLCYYLLVLDPAHSDPGGLAPLWASDPFYHNINGELYYYFDKKTELALPCWQKALTLMPEYAEVCNNLVVYHLEQTGDYRAAQEWALKACAYDGEELTYQLSLGEVYLKQNDKTSFEQLLSVLERKWPKNFEVLRLKQKGKSWEN